MSDMMILPICQHIAKGFKQFFQGQDVKYTQLAEFVTLSRSD